MQSHLVQHRIYPQNIIIQKDTSNCPSSAEISLRSLIDTSTSSCRDLELMNHSDSISEMWLNDFDFSESSHNNEERFSNSSREVSFPRLPSRTTSSRDGAGSPINRRRRPPASPKRKSCVDLCSSATQSPRQPRRRSFDDPDHLAAQSLEPQRRSLTRSKAFRVTHCFVSPNNMGHASFGSLGNKSTGTRSTALETLSESAVTQLTMDSLEDLASKDDSVLLRKAQMTLSPRKSPNSTQLSPRRAVGDVAWDESVANMSMLSLASIPEATGDQVGYITMGAGIRVTKSNDCSIDSSGHRSRLSSSSSKATKSLSDRLESIRSDSDESMDNLSASMSNLVGDFTLLTPAKRKKKSERARALEARLPR